MIGCPAIKREVSQQGDSIGLIVSNLGVTNLPPRHIMLYLS